MKFKVFLSTTLITAILIATFSSCLNANDKILDNTDTQSKTTTVAADIIIDTEFTDNELKSTYDEANAVKINFNNAKATVTGTGATAKNNIVTINSAGTYILSGTTTNGQVIVNAGAQDKIQLVLNNANITNTSNSPIYIQSADKVFLTLAKNSENTLTDSESYSDEALDGVIHSKADLTINGTGKLTINGNYKHGIISKDDLVVTGGTLNITSVKAGLYGKDCIKIADGNFILNCGTDGIQSDNTETDTGYIYIKNGNFEINAENDGIQAESKLLIDDGSFNIKAGEGSENVSFEMNPGFNNNKMFNRGNMGEMPADNYNPEYMPEHHRGNFNFENTNPPAGNFNSGNMPENFNPNMLRGGRGQGRFMEDLTEITTIQTATTENSSEITTSEAIENTTSDSKKAMKANNDITINNGTFNINSQDDSIHSNNTITINNGTFIIASGDDAIHCETDLLINNGNINITKSYEGIEGKTITINDGEISLISFDDGINSSDGTNQIQNPMAQAEGCVININSGEITVNGNGDGIDSNGTLNINGGTAYISGSENNGNSSVDAGKTVVTGGTVVATGFSGMFEGLSEDTTQYSIIHDFNSTHTGTDTIKLLDSTGNIIVEYTPDKAYQNVIISSPEIENGKTYTLSAGKESTKVIINSIITSNITYGGGMGMMPRNN